MTTQGDYDADPLGDGTFRMVPSGGVVSHEERNRRLNERAVKCARAKRVRAMSDLGPASQLKSNSHETPGLTFDPRPATCPAGIVLSTLFAHLLNVGMSPAGRPPRCIATRRGYSETGRIRWISFNGLILGQAVQVPGERQDA